MRLNQSDLESLPLENSQCLHIVCCMHDTDFSKPLLLDTTLRDGSYAVDFRFGADQAARWAERLRKAGVDYVEIGHGLGLRASSTAGMQPAVATDEQYLSAASEVVPGKFGMFFLPEIGKIEDIDLCQAYGAGFIRIGGDITSYNTCLPAIEHARRKTDMLVCANLLKSYLVNQDKFAAIAADVAKAGAQVVYLVDSAGGMLPNEVNSYIEAALAAGEIPVGFHGHDNNGLGLANSLMALQAGAIVVDSALQGIGRGGGNAPTEALIAVAQQSGMPFGQDLCALCDLGEELVAEMGLRKRIEPVQLLLGLGRIHSGLLPVIEETADQCGLDLKELIFELRGQAFPDEHTIKRVADRLVSEKEQVG